MNKEKEEAGRPPSPAGDGMATVNHERLWFITAAGHEVNQWEWFRHKTDRLDLSKMAVRCPFMAEECFLFGNCHAAGFVYPV